MSELKTLKDIGEYNDFKNTDIYKELKQEAIKWIKYYKINHRQGILPCEALMIFLNITDEDLK